MAAKVHAWQEVGPSRGMSVNTEGGHKGPRTHCQNNPARVPGGVTGGGRSTQQGFGEQGVHGDPDTQIALSIGLSGSSEQAFCQGHMK